MSKLSEGGAMSIIHTAATLDGVSSTRLVIGQFANNKACYWEVGQYGQPKAYSGDHVYVPSAPQPVM